MNLKFVGLNLDVTAALKDYTTSKLERIIRHTDQMINASVTFSVEKLLKKVEINLHLAGKDIHILSTDNDMYAAIDALMAKLDRAVIKHKEKKLPSRAVPTLRTESVAEEMD